MILVTHALAGAVIGKSIPDPILIIPTALAVHFLMDNLRHGEYAESFNSQTAFKNTWWKIALDFSVALLVVLAVSYFRNFEFLIVRNILIGVFFSWLPDGLTLIHWIFRRIKPLEQIYRFHALMHRFPRFSREREWTLRNAANDIWISSVSFLLLIFL